MGDRLLPGVVVPGVSAQLPGISDRCAVGGEVQAVPCEGCFDFSDAACPQPAYFA
jgi:hypothetical protein